MTPMTRLPTRVVYQRTVHGVKPALSEGGSAVASLKRWRQIGQGQFHKWETPGEEFEGTWRGMHDGRFGRLGTLETPEGLVTFPIHAALLERLKLVREGAEVLIRYTGKQTSKAGRVFK